jgi:hypothetical protein
MTDDVHGLIVDDSGKSTSDSELMHVNLVSGTYFPLLGVQAQLGRTLTDADDNSEGDHPVAVISQGFWKRSFASDPTVLHRKLKLGTTIFSIVGVAPDVWVPMCMTKSLPPGWDAYNKNFVQSMNIIGRLKPGVTLTQATSNVNFLIQQITRGFSDADLSQKNLAKLSKTWERLTPMANGLSSIRNEFSEPLQILMAVVALVLLIACINIANLLLARSTAAQENSLSARRSERVVVGLFASCSPRA